MAESRGEVDCPSDGGRQDRMACEDSALGPQVSSQHDPGKRLPRTHLIGGGPVLWIATGLGAGYARVAPGTFGTLWGLPLVGVLSQLSLPWYVASSVALIVASVPLCYLAALRLGGKDPSAVVLDEIASFPLVFVGIPLWAEQGIRWPLLLIGFVLHRVFDIAKPPPVRQLERLPGGWGIVADDLVAAAYAWLGVYAASRLWP
jgi:phosphatidylglycerophosphatase A